MRKYLAILLFTFAAFGQTQHDNFKHGISNILGAGARAAGMGGAFTAVADDATAASWNPAGLAQLSRPEVSLSFDKLEGDRPGFFGYAATLDAGGYSRSTWIDQYQMHFSAIGFASATYPLRIAGKSVVAQVSYRNLSTFPEGFGLEHYENRQFDKNGGMTSRSESENRFANTYSGAIRDYAASLAVPVTDRTSLGISANYLGANIVSTNAFGCCDANAALTDYDQLRYAFHGIYADIGILHTINEQFVFGAVYHTKFSSPFKYTTTLLQSEPQRQIAARTRITWPYSFAVGIAYRPFYATTFATDFSTTRWSEGNVRQYSYFDFEGKIQTTDMAPFPGFLGRNLDTRSLRFGAEHVFLHGNLAIPIRAGYSIDDQLTAELSNSQPRNTTITAGAGISYKRFEVDGAVQRTRGSEGSTYPTDPLSVGSTSINQQSVRTNRYILTTIVRF